MPRHDTVYNSKYIQDLYSEMFLRFAVAAEYKYQEIGKHIIRVSDYSAAIAKSMKISVEKIEIIRFASIMHDIGKIGIPDRILRRRKISLKDYDAIKEHAIMGSKIFAGSRHPLLKAAGEIALTHHEWYDGGGYPYGLKGKKIPIYGRVVALADSFDAIVSERGYKKSRTLEEALDIIKRETGTHFDPKVAGAFFNALGEIKDILKANKTIEDFLNENKKLLRKHAKD